MKNAKKNLLLVILVLLIIIVIGGTLIILKKKKEKNKINTLYEPQEEISISEERKAMVSLYFRNKTTKKIEPEVRLIDVKELVNNPYHTILNLLIEGPRKDTLEKIIPEGTKVNQLILQGDTLIIDFSGEFIENDVEGKETEQQIIDSIVKTLTELTEIDSIKILIDGAENKEFKDGEIKFNNIFIREE